MTNKTVQTKMQISNMMSLQDCLTLGAMVLVGNVNGMKTPGPGRLRINLPSIEEQDEGMGNENDRIPSGSDTTSTETASTISSPSTSRASSLDSIQSPAAKEEVPAGKEEPYLYYNDPSNKSYAERFREQIEESYDFGGYAELQNLTSEVNQKMSEENQTRSRSEEKTDTNQNGRAGLLAQWKEYMMGDLQNILGEFNDAYQEQKKNHGASRLRLKSNSMRSTQNEASGNEASDAYVNDLLRSTQTKLQMGKELENGRLATYVHELLTEFFGGSYAVPEENLTTEKHNEMTKKLDKLIAYISPGNKDFADSYDAIPGSKEHSSKLVLTEFFKNRCDKHIYKFGLHCNQITGFSAGDGSDCAGDGSD